MNYFYKSCWLFFCTQAFPVFFCISSDDLKNKPAFYRRYLTALEIQCSREVIIGHGFHREKFLVSLNYNKTITLV